jgi:hypothetical protein
MTTSQIQPMRSLMIRFLQCRPGILSCQGRPSSTVKSRGCSIVMCSMSSRWNSAKRSAGVAPKDLAAARHCRSRDTPQLSHHSSRRHRTNPRSAGSRSRTFEAVRHVDEQLRHHPVAVDMTGPGFTPCLDTGTLQKPTEVKGPRSRSSAPCLVPVHHFTRNRHAVPRPINDAGLDVSRRQARECGAGIRARGGAPAARRTSRASRLPGCARHP